MKIYNSRSEVEDKYKCNLNDFYKNEEEFEREFKKVEELIPKLIEYKGKLKNSDKLYEFLELNIDVYNTIENLDIYAYLKNDLDLGKEKNIKRLGKAENLALTYEHNTNFFEPELLKMTEDEFTNLLKNSKLDKYKKELEDTYRYKEHFLDEDKSNIISSLTNAMNIFESCSGNLKNNDIDYKTITVDGKEIELAVTNLRKFLRHKDENVRKQAYFQFYKELDKYENTFATLLNSYVSMKNEIAKIYNYKTSWDKKLFSEKLSNKVYDTLIKTTEDNLSPLHRYFKLTAKLQNKEKLTSYDLSLLNINKSDKKYSIEEANELVKESTKILGKEYEEKMTKIFDNHYIDYCQYKGKQSGGYSIASLDKDSRILMSFNEDFESVSTIAHEAGHNVNHQFMIENNLLHYRENHSIVAEVTSLLNECLLSNYIVENAKTKEEKLMGLANLIEVFAGNFYGSVREGTIEKDMYKLVQENGTLTKEYLNDLTYKSLELYGGKYKELDEYSKDSWILRSHYYMNYYLFSYAISIAVATSIAKKIIANDEKTLNNYLEFLKCGSDKDIDETFKILGVDLEDKKVYEEAVSFFTSLLDKYEEILNN